jgi:hypothetical protein
MIKAKVILDTFFDDQGFIHEKFISEKFTSKSSVYGRSEKEKFGKLVCNLCFFLHDSWPSTV